MVLALVVGHVKRDDRSIMKIQACMYTDLRKAVYKGNI